MEYYDRPGDIVPNFSLFHVQYLYVIILFILLSMYASYPFDMCSASYPFDVCSDRILTFGIRSICSPAKVGLVVTELNYQPGS